MAWYDEQKDKVFYNRRVLEQYCQDDVTVLRQITSRQGVTIALHHETGHQSVTRT